MSSVITLLRVLPEFYEYGRGTLIWRLLYVHTYVPGSSLGNCSGMCLSQHHFEQVSMNAVVL